MSWEEVRKRKTNVKSATERRGDRVLPAIAKPLDNSCLSSAFKLLLIKNRYNREVDILFVDGCSTVIQYPTSTRRSYHVTRPMIRSFERERETRQTRMVCTCECEREHEVTKIWKN